MDGKFQFSSVSVMKEVNVIAASEAIDDEKEPKLSKISSVLDACCKTSFLDESSDFIECEFKNNLKVGHRKCEKFICEICKTDITDLSVDKREIHVNNCIDKQISSQSEIQPPRDENVVMLGCPFCSRQFSSPQAQSNHIKRCGKTKGLNPQNIIQALELEKRYALERISLGLPAKPVKPVRPQKTVPIKKVVVEPKSKAESDIQLAKALSLSLAKEAAVVSPIKLNPPTTFQRPGKKNKAGVTPLLVLRSDEDRRRLLLQKVATIVEPGENCHKNILVSSENVFSSEQHKEDFHKVSVLWNLSSKSTGKNDYYVEELLSWVNPSEIEVGDKFRHLSQIAGHEIVTQLPCDYTFSPSLEDEHLTDECPNIQSTELNSFCVTESLCSLVASPWMSDTDVHTSCGTVIPAHRLLLALRCPPLKKDHNFCLGEKRNVLKWANVSFDSALQFLNFIYTGKIEVKENILQDLFFLAKKYEVVDLQHILQSFQSKNTLARVKEDERSYLTSCFQQEEMILATSDSNIKGDDDLEIVCDFLNTDLKPSPLRHSQLSTYLKSSQDEIILSPRNFNPSKLDIKNEEGSFVLTEGNPQSPNENEAVLNASSGDAISWSRKYKEVDEYSNESGGFIEVLEQNEVFCTNSCENLVIKSEEIEVENTENQDSVKLFDSNLLCSNFNQNQKSKWKEIDVSNIENEDSFKCLNPCLLSLSNSCQNRETMSKENDVLNKEKQVTLELLDPNLFSSSNLHGDSETKLKVDVCCTEKKDSVKLLEQILTSSCNLNKDSISKSKEVNGHYPESKDCTKLLELSLTSSGNLYQDKKTQDQDSKMSTVPSEVEIVFKKPAFEMDEVLDSLNSRTRVETNNFELADDLMLKFCKSPEKKFVTAKDVPTSSRVRFSETSNFELAADSILQFSESPAEKSGMAKDIPSSPRTRFSKTSKFELAADSILQFSEYRGRKSVMTKDVPSSPRTRLSETSNFELTADSILQFPESPGGKSVIAKDVPSSPVVFDVDDSSSDFDNSENSEVVRHCTNLNFPKGNSGIIGGKDPDGLLELNCASFNDLNQSLVKIQDPLISSQFKPFGGEIVTNKVPTNSQNKKIRTLSGLEDSDKIGSENNCRKKPVSKDTECHAKFKLSDSPVTPLPDYKNMMTPEIKQALRKIGVKALPRKKAITLLSHIYNETHPLLNSEGNSSSSQNCSQETSLVNESKKRKHLNENAKPPTKKQKENNMQETSQESDDDASDNPEWLGCVPEISFSQFKEGSPTKINKDDIKAVKQYIQSSENVYNNILNYKPLNMIEFHQELKDNGIKISVQKLMDFLDEQCITFTCPRKEEYRKKQTARTQRFRKNMIIKLSQQTN